jgi:hypothetical protein
MTTPQAGAYDDIVKAAYKNGIPVATTNSFDGGIHDRLGISHTGQDASAAAIAGAALAKCLMDKGVESASVIPPSCQSDGPRAMTSAVNPSRPGIGRSERAAGASAGPRSERLVQLDQIAGGIGEERLETDAVDLARGGHLDAACRQLGSGRREVGDLERNVLTLRRLEVGDLDQVDLLLTGIEPRAAKREVGPIEQRHLEHIGVKRLRRLEIGNVQRHVVNAGELHLITLL